MAYKTPGVYVEEISKFPPSVAAVETAIPAFIGYTEKAKRKQDGDLLLVPLRISSLLEFTNYFGTAMLETGITVDIDTTQSPTNILASIANVSNYRMYYAMQAFFLNGGGPCYIVSIGDYSSSPVVDLAALQSGLAEIAKVDEVTLLVSPDSPNLSTGDYYTYQRQCLDQCVELGDRFSIIDVRKDADDTIDNVDVLRSTLAGTVDVLKYGAAYYPQLETILDYQYDPGDVTVTLDGSGMTLSDLESANNALYNQAKGAISQISMIMYPSSLMAGVYASVDNTRGVWKAPANVSVTGVIKPVVPITDQSQEGLNVDVVAGKSINAIRTFTGKGVLVWGARTLAGNDNEWRYVSVRRFFNMVEESVKKASSQFVFEPNDANTWTKVRAMIENFLTLQWRAGALMGTTPEKAFFVKVGLGETMTALDVLEGRMIVEIGMAVVRPAEFIILRFMHKMPEA